MCYNQKSDKNTQPSLTNKKNAVPIKTILVGESRVGKTSIISRFINPSNKELKATAIESVTKSLSIGGKYISLYITFDMCDTMGQEKFRALPKIFYKDAGVIIFVYDISEKKSFDEIKNYWYQRIKKNVTKFFHKNFVLGVVGNKYDLYKEEQVSEEEARKFAKEIGAIFKLTSALNNTGIEELFKSIAFKVLEHNYFDKEVTLK